jgi:hypothetical protein
VRAHHCIRKYRRLLAKGVVHRVGNEPRYSTIKHVAPLAFEESTNA